MNTKTVLLDDKAINRAITRIAHEIIEKNKGVENIVLVGIKTRGVPLANRLCKKIYEIENVEVPTVTLDITLYRDDLTEIGEEPIINSGKFDYDITGKIVVIVDDVLYTGRTVRAALDALLETKRPEKIELAILIDRGHRELPIRADFVGKNVPTSKNEIVSVMLEEVDDTNKVVIKKIK